jgi:hypothetical protein
MPIYDCNGEQLGVVSADGVLEQYLIMTKGHLWHHDVNVPLSAVARSDARGVYLNRTKRDISDLTMGGWSSLGDVDPDTGVLAGGAPPAPGPADPPGERGVRQGP